MEDCALEQEIKRLLKAGVEVLDSIRETLSREDRLAFDLKNAELIEFAEMAREALTQQPS